MWEEKGWWGPNAYKPNDSSFANKAGLAIQGLQNAAGVAGGHVKRYGLKLFNELTTEPERKKHLLEQSAESLMGVAGAGTLDIASEVALANIHRLPEKLRTPAVIGSLLIGSLDGGVPRLRGGNLQRINDLTQAANVSTEFRSASIPDRKTNPKKAKTAATVKSLGNIPEHKNGDVNGHTNGEANGTKNGDPSTPVNILEMRRGAVETLNKGETDLLEQIKELQAKQPKPGSPEARVIRKLNEKVGQYRRSKAAIIQTLYDDDMVMEMYNNILSAKGLSKSQIDFFNRLKTPLSLKGYNTPVHHRAWLQSIAQPFYDMDLAKGLETQQILVDKHGRHLGDATPNFTTILDKGSHDVAHFGNTADTRFRKQFAKLDLSKMSAEEIADKVEGISQKMDMQTGVGITSKANTQKGLDLLETLPKDFLRQLSPDFNVLDSLSPDWDKFRAWIQNLHPDFKPLLNPQSQAQVESIQLQSMNIA